MAERGRMVDGIKLQDEGGRVMSRNGGKPSIRDVAYAEAKEVIGGIFVILAADYDEAAELACDCPHLEHGTILLREVHDLGGSDAA